MIQPNSAEGPPPNPLFSLELSCHGAKDFFYFLGPGTRGAKRPRYLYHVVWTYSLCFFEGVRPLGP